MLANRQHLRKYDNDFKRFFDTFLSDMLALNKMFSIKINGIEKKFKFILSHITGDKLGIHKLAGYQISFSFGKICRNFNIYHKHLENHLI